MKIIKENEIVVEDDIYFLLTIKNRIIINNNYDGIFVINKKLDFIKNIDICPDFCVYNALVLNDENILFNCIDNNMFFVVNIETDEIKKCKIPAFLENHILMKIVQTEGDSAIIKTYGNSFLKFNYHEMIFSICDKNIQHEEKKEEISQEFIRCIKTDDFIANMRESYICITKNNRECKILPQLGYRFWGIDVIGDDKLFKLVVLSVNNSEKAILTVYNVAC